MVFEINNVMWTVRFCSPNSSNLMRSDGTWTIGMTDISTHEVWIANNLSPSRFRKVLCHEICHCAMSAYYIDLSIGQEELFCQLFAEYGEEVIDITDKIFMVMKRGIA